MSTGGRQAADPEAASPPESRVAGGGDSGHLTGPNDVIPEENRPARPKNPARSRLKPAFKAVFVEIARF